MTEPSFVLADAERVVVGHGSLASWTSVDEAGAARRAGATVVGAIGFDPSTPAVLWQPETLTIRPRRRAGGPERPAPRACARAVCTERRPEPEEHRRRIAEVVSRIRDGRAEKVVLGRWEHLELDPPSTPGAALEGFRSTDPVGNGYLVDLGDRWLVGSSPEVLVARDGRRVTAFPLAGTRSRRGTGTDLDDDARELLSSTKDLDEHRFVTDALARVLAPLCSELTVPANPSVVATPTTWHLGTPVEGVLRDPGTSALDLAVLVHPTPALCGTPDDDALAIIRDVEGIGDRGLFGGAVGWCDAGGDGAFRVTIRGAELSRDGRTARAWAGGGLTAHSDPDAELAETAVKLSRARQGLTCGGAAGGRQPATAPGGVEHGGPTEENDPTWIAVASRADDTTSTERGTG